MAEEVFGEVDWNSGDSQDYSGERKSDFLKLEQGKTKVRIMGNPIQFYTHWLTLPGGKKKKINSPVSDPKLVKQLEDAGFKKQKKWMVKVLDRTDDTFKILEIGAQIRDGIRALVADDAWGPITTYDITIERGPEGQQPLYRVTPRPKQPLDQSLTPAFQKFNERVDLSKFTKAAEPQEVRELLGWTEKTGSVSKTQESDDEMFNFED